jgi:hypothetical protein
MRDEFIITGAVLKVLSLFGAPVFGTEFSTLFSQHR